MDEDQKKIQESLLLEKQVALLKGENVKLKLQVKRLLHKSEEQDVKDMTPNEIKVEIKQCKLDKLNLAVAIDNKAEQIMKLEKNISEMNTDKEVAETNLAELRHSMRILKSENELIKKEIQRIRRKLEERSEEDGESSKAQLELEGKQPMAIMVDQLEADVQRLSDKLTSLPVLQFQSISADEQMMKFLREQLAQDEGKIKALEDEIKQLEIDSAEFEAQRKN